MADVRSQFGGVGVGADITGNAEFVTIHTVAAHTSGNFGTSNSATRNTIQLAEMIQQKTNINYINISSAVVDLSNATTAAFYGLGSDYNQASTTVYTIKFVAEQSGYVTTANLETLVDGITLPFTTTAVPITGPSTRSITAYDVSGINKNTSIVVSANL